MRSEVGARCRLRALWWDGPLPVPGDFLRTAAGSCYRVERVRAGVGAGGAPRATFVCTRLEREAVQLGEPGVFAWRWAPRRARGRAEGPRRV